MQPRPLRSISNSISGFNDDNIQYGLFDLELDSGGEETSRDSTLLFLDGHMTEIPSMVHIRSIRETVLDLSEE